MLYIARSCDKKNRPENAVSYVLTPDKNGAALALPLDLKAERAEAKKRGNWNNATYCVICGHYINRISNPEGRDLLNKMFRELRSGKDVVIVVPESEAWATSQRRFIAGLFLGAGVEFADIRTDAAMAQDDRSDLTSFYDRYKVQAAAHRAAEAHHAQRNRQ